MIFSWLAVLLNAMVHLSSCLILQTSIKYGSTHLKKIKRMVHSMKFNLQMKTTLNLFIFYVINILKYSKISKLKKIMK